MLRAVSRLLISASFSGGQSPGMRTTIEAFKQAGLRDQVKILIGGAPITQKYADEIGADGYSENAPAAVTLAKRVLAMS